MLNHFAPGLPKTVAHAGQLDSGFANGGKVSIQFRGSTSSLTTGMAVDRHGRILVAAKVETAQGSRFGLARLNHDGSPDKGFGTLGCVIGAFEQGFEATAGKVIVLPDASILLSGLHYESADRTLPALALFDQQGRAVPGFGHAGRTIIRLCGNLSQGLRDPWLPPGVPGLEACDMRVQADGRILLLANHHFQLSDHVGILIRLLPDGSLDSTFNSGGFVMVRRLLKNTWLSCLALQADGNILAGGAIDLPQQGLMARYDPSGRLDDSFGDNGFLSITTQERSVMISQIVQHENGDLQAFGSSRDPMQCLTLKVRPDGQADLQFNQGQCRLLQIGRSASQWTAAQLQSDGKLVTAGATIGGIEADFVLARHLPDGCLDPFFGQGRGWTRTRLGYSLDTATSLALQADDKILVGGYSLHGNYRAVVARYWA
ncbi:delta-60 repeat domain-containing protein [Pseudomonas sp. NFACC49-2]|uniref:delta-60 repeat domain-containing protein n=1 Tax=Pseudomonas sp. NFACC49-2 TaxID=1566222 RepID=UPI00091DB10E|nr:delta-60 repeat domain-containing protein [Pseudomonas sp. NFACC49-2]SFY04177.1 delta-60 repeat domain-containing protein [Pseudomonas sp. NFACC49-2]